MIAITATRANNPIKNGITRPYYITCDDNEIYVAKFAQNPEGTRVLANEYICAEIASDLALPIPSPALITVQTEFIEVYGAAIESHLESKILPGIHFGTQQIKKAVPITSAKLVSQADNLYVIPELLVFDFLIYNSDRDSNAGNLLFDISTNSIAIIDHTHAFKLGAIWDETQLRRLIGQPFDNFNYSGYVYSKLAGNVKGNNPFNTILSKISRMTNERLWHIINSVPEEWNVNIDEKHALHDFLVDRKNRIEEALPIMKDFLPNWKGGF